MTASKDLLFAPQNSNTLRSVTVLHRLMINPPLPHFTRLDNGGGMQGVLRCTGRSWASGVFLQLRLIVEVLGTGPPLFSLLSVATTRTSLHPPKRQSESAAESKRCLVLGPRAPYV